MTKYLKVSSILLAAIFLTACNHKNPVLSVEPAAFVKAVDAYYRDLALTDNSIRVCASYYYDTAKARKVAAKGLLQVNVDNLARDCRKPLKALAEHLNQASQFKGLKLEDLESADTWKVYFNTKHHLMGDFFDDGKEAQKFLEWKKQY